MTVGAVTNLRNEIKTPVMRIGKTSVAKKKAGPQVHHVNYPTILTFSIVALSKVYVRWVHLLCFTFRNQNDKVRLPVNEKGA